MASEQFANSLLVEVAGSPLPADVAGLLSYAYVDNSRNLPDRFLLRYRDPSRTVLKKGGFEIGAKVKLTVQSSDPGGPLPLMSGEVTAMEFEYDTTGTFAEIRGLDVSHRLFRGRRVATYPNMTVADVVRKVAQRAGVKIGTIDTVQGFGGRPESQITQDNVSDWEFLTRLAEWVGAQVLVLDDALHFRLPEPPSGAPAPSTKATQNPLVLEVNGNLIAIRAGITAGSQVSEVNAWGWDMTKKAPVKAKAKPTAAGTQVTGVDPVKLGGVFKAPPYLVSNPTMTDDPTVNTVAKAMAGEIGGGFAEIEGVAKGNGKLRAGTAVALANVGEPFQGKYVLTSTRHLFSEQAGYTTAFTVSGRSDRSLYSMTGGGHGMEHVANGLVPAIVSDINDPQKLGRVKLVLPWLDDRYTTTWARVLQPGGGKDRGHMIVPEVDDEVLVGFSDNNLESAYVLGGLHNPKDKPPKLETEPVESGKVVNRALVSRTGHRLELIESTSGADGVLLSTGDKKFTLRLDKKGRLIEIISDNQIKVTAKNGITIDSGTGPLDLLGQKVTVKSKTDVGVEATAKVNIKGSAGAKVEGAIVQVAGQTTTEVTASGTVVVRGGMVRIN